MWRAWAWVAAVFFVAVQGALADPRLTALPLSPYWNLHQVPLAGEVQRIVETTTHQNRPPNRPITMTYFSLPDNGRRLLYGDPSRPTAMVDYDASFRPQRVVAQSRVVVPDGPVREAVLTQTVTYDKDGRLASFRLEGHPVGTIDLPVKITPIKDGGYRAEFTVETTGQPRTTVMEFDARHRMTRIEPSKMPNVTGANVGIARNDRGDYTELTLGGTRSWDLFEYEYDKQGNWIKRQRIVVRMDKRSSEEITTRQITYGPLPPASDQVRISPPASRPIVAAGGSTAPGQPATTRAAAAAVAAVPAPASRLPAPKQGAEIYRRTIGKKGSGFSIETTVVLNPDKTGTLRMAVETRDGSAADEFTTTWELHGNQLHVVAQKTPDGKDVQGPEANHSFVKTPEGALQAEFMPHILFNRLTE